MDSVRFTRSSPRVASELPSRPASALPVSRASSLRSEDGRARLYSDVVSSRSPVRGGKVPGRVATGADGRVDDVPRGNDKCIFGYPKSGRTALDLDNRSDSEIPWTTVQRKSKSVKDPLSIIDIQLNAIYMSVQSLTEKDQEKVSKKLRKILETIEPRKAAQSDIQLRLAKESLPSSFEDMRLHEDHVKHNGASQPFDRYTLTPSLVAD